MIFKTARFLVGTVLAITCVASSASVITYNDRTAFNSQGTITENSNFNDFGAGFSSPGNPFVRGNVTYTSADNLTVGSSTGYSIGNSQTVIANNYWTPITGNISNQFDLFGFDIAVTSGLVNISLNTNLGSYAFNGLSIPNGSPDFAFEGFQTTSSGEYFTGFRIDTAGAGNLAGITNVALGNSGSVPEPATIALLGLGMLGFLVSRRRKQ